MVPTHDGSQHRPARELRNGANCDCRTRRLDQSTRTNCEREIVGRGLFATGRMCQCVFVRVSKDCKTRPNNRPPKDFDGPSARLFGCFCGHSPPSRRSASGQEHEPSNRLARSFIQVGDSSRWIVSRNVSQPQILPNFVIVSLREVIRHTDWRH